MTLGRPLRSRRQKTRQNLTGWLFAGLAILVLAAVMIGKFIVDSGPKTDQRGCLVNSEPPASTVFLIDSSDSFSPVQRHYVLERLEAVLDTTQQYERVSLFVLDQQSLESLEPAMERCNPGTGESLNELTGNPKLQIERWKKQFSEPLRAKLRDAVSGTSQEESPILRMIQAVSVRSFGSKLSDAADKRLIIVSDLLEHTDSYSHYRSPLDFEAFQTSQVFDDVWVDLSGVDVNVFYVRRAAAHNIQGTKHITEFWEKYFGALGGQLGDVQRVPGT